MAIVASAPQRRGNEKSNRSRRDEGGQAMAFCDEWLRAASKWDLPPTPDEVHRIANRAAAHFLHSLIAYCGGVGSCLKKGGNP